MTDSHTTRLESALAGRYKIQRKLGEGGMASVYLAEDIKHERKVALKILKPELAAVIGAERFLAEIKTTANLQHPHILPLFDSGEADGFLYYVMPYIDGETLRERLDREGQLGVEEAVRIARDVADALDYAHRAGVIHRDIKPANILLHDGRPVVADFGIAVAISAAGGGRMTETGLSLGTPHYMSPEQASADRDLSARSDVYSLGCVLYEMLAGQPPHTGPSAQSILVRILTEDPRSVTELRRTVPPHVAAVVMKSIEKLPADRFDSARQFIDALGDAGFTYVHVSGATGAAARPKATSSPTGASWWTDTRSRIAVAAIAILAVLGAMAMLNGGPAATAGSVPVTRFDILDPDPDDEMVLIPFVTAISPDGAHVALMEGVLNGGGELGILIRDMDGTELRRLTPDEMAFFPEFSPDGTLVAYGVPGAIKVIPVFGGTPRTIFRLEGDDTQPIIAQWAPDGRILFTAEFSAGEVQAVPSEGADSAEVVFRADRDVQNPQLLPGGRFLLFHTVGEEPELHIADLEADSSWTLQPEGAAARYVESGHVIYEHPGQSLFSFPFDVRTGQATGRPVPLMDSVASFIFGRGFDVARNGTLVYVRGDLRAASLMSDRTFVEVDTTGSSSSIALEPSAYFGGRYSPDGAHIAFEDDDQIVVFHLATGTTTRLTVDGENSSPVWSPDGSELAFRSERDGSADGDLYRKRVDGTTDAERITSLEGSETPWAWTEDDVVVFTHTPDADNTDILMVTLGSDEEPTPYLNAPWRESEPALSPDGRWMAYRSWETSPGEIFVRSFPEAAGRWQVSEGGAWEAKWSPDGAGIWYRSSGDVMLAEVSTDPTFAVGARRTVLQSSDFNGFSWDIHPDGDRFLALRSGSEEAQTQLQQGGRFRVVVNWFEELRRQGLLGDGR